MERARELLKDHPVNRARERRGLTPANAIWFWGEGRRPALPAFAEKTGLRGAVISAVDLVQGIGLCAGMRVIKVPGATGTWRTNFSGKAEAAMRALENGADFAYVHLEAPDECGHQHQVEEKVYAIEQIDEKVLGPLLDWLEGRKEGFAALAMPDHPTPLTLRTHTAEPVPFALYRGETRRRRDCRYTERAALSCGLTVAEGHTLIDRMLCRGG